MKIAVAGVLMLWGAQALAQALAPITPEEVSVLQADIARIDALTAERRAAAERDLAARNAECYKKVLVSSCLEKSRKLDVAARVDIRKLEAESRRLAREIRLRQDITRKAEQEAQAPEREAEAAARAARNREEAERREAEFLQRQADHQHRLEQGRQRAAREAEQQRERDAENQRKHSEQEAAARERARHTPPPALPSSGTRPYTPPTIDLPAAPASLAPKR